LHPRKTPLDLLGNRLFHRTVAVLGEGSLRLGRAQEGDERLGEIATLVLVGIGVDDGHRVLDQDGRVRHHVLVVTPCLTADQYLVLVGNCDVTHPLLESDDRLPRTLVHHAYVAQDVGEQLFGGGRVSLRCRGLAAKGCPIQGTDVPHGPTARAYVRSQYVQMRRAQVVPVANALRIAGPHGEHDDRPRHHPVRGPGLPIVGDEARLGDALQVGLERERGDVGLEAADDGP
jgi:hypothetical protein